MKCHAVRIWFAVLAVLLTVNAASGVLYVLRARSLPRDHELPPPVPEPTTTKRIPPVTTKPGERPKPKPNESDPPKLPKKDDPSPQKLKGDLLILLVDTVLLGKDETDLRNQLVKLHEKYKRNLLGGNIYLIDKSGQPRAWTPAEPLMPGKEAFACEDFGAAFAAAFKTMDALTKQAVQPDALHRFLLWKSDYNPDMDPSQKLPAPGQPMMLIWMWHSEESSRLKELFGPKKIAHLDRKIGDISAAVADDLEP